MQAMVILIRVICYLDDAFPQGESLIEVLVVSHALEVQVVLVHLEVQEAMGIACGDPLREENDH